MILFNDKSIFQFSARIQSMSDQIISLSRILGSHPDTSTDDKLPIGSDFLGYLYKEIIQLTKKDVLMLYISILSQCCHVYFK